MVSLAESLITVVTEMKLRYVLTLNVKLKGKRSQKKTLASAGYQENVLGKKVNEPHSNPIIWIAERSRDFPSNQLY